MIANHDLPRIIDKKAPLPITLVLFCLTMIVANAASVAAIAAEGESSKPNVLFIAIDDLRPELGCYGVTEIKTPQIDALAASGVTFNRAYCQFAVCNPSRVSLLTGLRPDSSRVWDLVTRFRQTVPDIVTLPQQFMQHGYHAVSYGKIFHNPWPDNASWSEPHQWPEQRSLWSKEAKQRHAAYRKRMRAEGKAENAVNRIRAQATEMVDVPADQHIDGAIARQALAAMRRLAKRDQPFFLAAGFVRPHLPFVAPRKYWELYQADAIPSASNPFLPRQAPRFAINTMYEVDVRVPLIIRDPRAEANGQTSDALVEFVDVYPTLCDLAGLPLPEHLEGKSMWRLLSNPDQSFKQAAFSQFHRQDGSVPLMGYAMRTQRYRYVEWQDRRTREVVTAELYDHDSDSEENNNIAGQPDNRALLTDLSRQMWTALPQPPEYVARNPVPIAARPSEE